jgi:hypothetical protein
MESMRRSGLYAAVALCVCGLSATPAAERFGQWSLEQPEDFIFALSFKRSISFDDNTATSQLAFRLQRRQAHPSYIAGRAGTPWAMCQE